MKKLLVVVDMQNDFVTGCLGTPEARAIVPALTEYVKNFDGEVIFTKDTHEKNYLETQEGKYLPVTHCIRGPAGWGIITELKPYVGNDFYCKKTFGSVELANKIKSGNYDEVQFCGVCTGICVISNALMAKAFSPETPIKVLKDLCACVTPESHEIALNAMKLCQIDII